MKVVSNETFNFCQGAGKYLPYWIKNFTNLLSLLDRLVFQMFCFDQII